jgi:hypothetical protein
LEVSPRSAYRDKSLAYFGQGKWPSGLSNEPCNGLPDLHACSLRVRRGRLAPHHAPEALQLTAALKRNIHNVFIGVSVRLSPPCNSDRKEFLVEPDILLTWRQQEPPTRREAQEW